jgi:hypothetical protein
MSVKYLLPCSCGRTVPVEVRQSGLDVRCECGATLVVPVLRDLKQLAVQPESSARRPFDGAALWTWRQQYRGIAVLLLLGGLGIAAFGWSQWRPLVKWDPNDPRLNYYRDEYRRLPFAELHKEWVKQQQGIDRTDRFYDMYSLGANLSLLYIGVGGLLAAGGVALFAASFTGSAPKPGKPRAAD